MFEQLNNFKYWIENTVGLSNLLSILMSPTLLVTVVAYVKSLKFNKNNLIDFIKIEKKSDALAAVLKDFVQKNSSNNEVQKQQISCVVNMLSIMIKNSKLGITAINEFSEQLAIYKGIAEKEVLTPKEELRLEESTKNVIDSAQKIKPTTVAPELNEVEQFMKGIKGE